MQLFIDSRIPPPRPVKPVCERPCFIRPEMIDTPEPATFALLGLSLLAFGVVGLVRRRRARR